MSTNHNIKHYGLCPPHFTFRTYEFINAYSIYTQEWHMDTPNEYENTEGNAKYSSTH